MEFINTTPTREVVGVEIDVGHAVAPPPLIVYSRIELAIGGIEDQRRAFQRADGKDEQNDDAYAAADGADSVKSDPRGRDHRALLGSRGRTTASWLKRQESRHTTNAHLSMKFWNARRSTRR